MIAMTPGRQIVLLLIAALFAGAACAADLNEELLAAVRKGDAATVKALLAKGAEANAKFRYERTALSFAAARGHLEVVKILLEQGADPNVKDTFYGASAMTWAVSGNHADIVRALLAKGADAGRDAALLMGATRGHADIVQAVLDKGGLKQEQLNAALSRAVRNNHGEIAELLKKAGAQPPPKADFQVDPDTLKSYAGVYKGDAGELTLSVKDGKLAGGPTGQNPVTLGALDKVTFTPLELEGITATFNLEDGKVVSVTIKQGNNAMVYKKVEAK